MTTWESIKNLPGTINGSVKTATNNVKKIYTNEEIMTMFLFKLNDRYRYSRLVDMGVQSDMDRTFLEAYEGKKNYIDMAVMKIDKINLNEKIKEIKSQKDVKKNPLLFRMELFENSVIDKVLFVSAIPQITNLAKYRYLAKILYEKDKKYLEYAKETIILNNSNISLDKMVFGVGGITQKIMEKFNNCMIDKNILILWILLTILLLYFGYQVLVIEKVI